MRPRNLQAVYRGGIRLEHPIDLSLIASNMVIATTNGTTAVDVFGSKGAPANLTITGCFLISNDTTAGNITPKTNGNTVATIAKGTASGALVGAASLSNTTVKAGQTVQVVSISAGNAQVFIFFTFDTV